jgi:hypothetical protein|tara:strand:- start:1175 stop:1693 length:519 start_codon:yes stop_codon:yes gene_type:complete
MSYLSVNYSKGQLKIQQMAFVLVATMIFFAIVFLFYGAIRSASLENDVEDLRKQEIIETIRQISATAEFSWTREDCSACIDMDKVLMLKNRTAYQGFWKQIPLLQIARVYPSYGGNECTTQNYPECDLITIIEKDTNLVAHSSFVSLCRYEPVEEYYKCELGKVRMAYETIE